MKTHRRLVLMVVAVGLAAIAALLSGGFLESLALALGRVPSGWWPVLALAVAVQFAGHWLRMLRTKTVMDQVRQGRQADQFAALSAGYFFGLVLPLRLGEAIRAALISVKLKISFLYTITAIIIERAADLLVIGLLVIGVAGLLSGASAIGLLLAALGAIVFSLLVLLCVFSLVYEKRWMLALVWRATGWFNEKLRNNLRFKVWSLIFGLQQFIRDKQSVRHYIAFTAASWACYLFSTALLAGLLGIGPFASSFIAAAGPYVAAGAPLDLVQTYGYEKALGVVLGNLGAPPQLTETYTLLSWALLALPMFAVGFICLFFVRLRRRRLNPAASPRAFTNKLLRQSDISQEFPAFLDSYFSGHNLAHVLHKLELSGELSLVKFFKGGSDAITVLVLAKNELFVKKIIPLAFQDRLKAQYNWLKNHQNMPGLVKVLGQQRTEDYYAIDLEYDPNNIPYFEYLHHNSLGQAKSVLDETWQMLYKHLYKRKRDPGYYPDKRDAFIKKHILGCAQIAAEAHGDIQKALDQPQIKINGLTYDNLYQIIEKIKQSKEAWRDIATFQLAGEVDGDLTVDNILVSSVTNKPLIIDPAPDGNIIEGPVFDMGKLMQSFYCGYEFLFRDEEPVELNPDGSINYRDNHSHKYTSMTAYVQQNLAPKYLTEPEQRSLIFHAGALHIRRLKHQVHSNPQNALKFYAVGVKALNEFLEQYQTPDSAS